MFVQSKIDRLISLKSKPIEDMVLWSKEERDRFFFSKHSLEQDIIYELNKKGQIPVYLNNTKLNVFYNDAPVIFSYEKLNNKLSILWDSNHIFDKFVNDYKNHVGGYRNIPTRIDIFIQGVKKVNPEVLALELTADNDQKLLNYYLCGLLPKENLNKSLIGYQGELAVLQDYAKLMDYCIENGIAVVCVDLNYHELANEKKYFPEKLASVSEQITALEKEIESGNLTSSETSNKAAELFKIKNIYYQKSHKIREKRVADNLKKISSQNILLAFGAAHRPGLLSLLE